MQKNPLFQNKTTMVIRKSPLVSEYNRLDEENPQQENLPREVQRKKPDVFPHLKEPLLMRHYHRLARMNYSWDDGLYPLGSCTMKYNPVLHDSLSARPAYLNAHPAWGEGYTQGALRLVYETQKMLEDILDIHSVNLQPAAGAHGELTGVLMIRRYFEDKGVEKKTILIPDSAHGTNPASAMMAAFDPVQVKSRPDGTLDLEDLKNKINDKTAALMITNPNTLGVFEKNIIAIKEILEKYHALLFMDGANLNAIAGRISFKKMGVDVTQMNLHKTFSTPHGGGGPGQGAIGASERMAPYLPNPSLRMTLKDQKPWYEFYSPAKSIGKMKAWYGQFGIIIRAWAYLKTVGNRMADVSGKAVLNANYIKKELSGFLEPASENPSMHEAVFSQKTLADAGISTMNLAKALLDRGFYAPTVYFPLNVPGAIMIEPTETESKEEMDYFISCVREIVDMARASDEGRAKIAGSPYDTAVRHPDEVGAARNPRLKW